MENYCDASHAQDEYEAGLQIGEDLQIEALSRAEVTPVHPDDFAFELAECADQLGTLIAMRDAGKVGLSALGLALMNVRNAARQRACGVFAAPDAAEAVELAMRWVAL